jgi:uncharacterized repeat protein (TIGR03803 family)
MPSAISRLILSALIAASSIAASAQKETVLHSFSGSDGANPYSTLAMDTSGNLYGTTQGGGEYGYGTVFALSPQKQETVLYSFCKLASCADGATPYAGVILDSQNNLYGTTNLGGEYDNGTIFKVNSAGVETVLYSFKGSPGDGELPHGGLVFDAKGNIYGTTEAGGVNGTGTVFKLTPSGKESIVYNFAPSDSTGPINPFAGLTINAEGNFYGTSITGGTGLGTVFKLTPGGDETTLYTFGSNDGYAPYGGITLDSKGNLYGTASGGGANQVGVVFKLSPSGRLLFSTSLSRASGDEPYANLVLDSKGNIYGTAFGGGANGSGAVFKLPRSGASVTALYSFCSQSNCSDGVEPRGGLIFDSNGVLYGTAIFGGNSTNSGVVYKLVP